MKVNPQNKKKKINETLSKGDLKEDLGLRRGKLVAATDILGVHILTQNQRIQQIS